MHSKGNLLRIPGSSLSAKRTDSLNWIEFSAVTNQLTNVTSVEIVKTSRGTVKLVKLLK